jgi:hypothetical protein
MEWQSEFFASNNWYYWNKNRRVTKSKNRGLINNRESYFCLGSALVFVTNKIFLKPPNQPCLNWEVFLLRLLKTILQ